MNCSSFEDKKGKLYFVAGLDDHSQLYFFSKRMELARSLSYSDQNDNGTTLEGHIQLDCVINHYFV